MWSQARVRPGRDGTGVAWSMKGQIELAFLERMVYSDRVV